MVSLKRKLLAVFAFSVWIGAGSPVHAQTTKTLWTLQECIDYALQNNLQIKQYQLDAEGVRINFNQSRANLLPGVDASSNYGFQFGRNVDPVTDVIVDQQIRTSNLSVNAYVPLFNGFQLRNGIKQQRFNIEAARLDIENIKNDVILNIVSAFVQVILSEELLQNARLQLQSTQTQADRTQKLFRAGSVAESNVLEINAQVATDELAIIDAQNQKDLAELSLIQLLDLKQVKDFELVKPVVPDPDQEQIILNDENIFEFAQANLPEIKSADLRVQSALKGIDVSRGAYLPQLSLGVGLGTRYSYLVDFPLDTSPFFEQYKNNLGRGITFNLSIPIFSQFQTRNNVARSIINHKLAVLNTEVARNQVRRDIQQSYADALAAQKRFDATKRQLAAFAQAFRNAEIRFNNGLINPTDYNVAKNNFVKAQSDLVQAKYQYTFKLKVLDFYQGKPLAL